MPAGYLTADCIWNSFRSSGKRHLILTGTRGSGKTTLLKQLFPQSLPGLTTWAKPGQAVYLQDNLSQETVQVGIFDETLPGPENRMTPMEDGFASLGVAALERYAESGHQWICIDEIGYLEAQCEVYLEALRKLFEKKQVVAVVRKQELPALVELCSRKDAFVIDLDNPFGNAGCVIMASGLGKRFGGNKLMADFDGKPLICRILDATDGIFSQRVVVTRHEDVAQICKERGIHCVLHDLPHRSDTVRLGLEALSGVERCMFVPADQPLLRKETVFALCLAAVNGSDFIWRAACEGISGSPVIFPRWAFSELLNLPEGKGGGAVIKKYPECVHMVSVQDMYELKDVDSPEDLTELLSHTRFN